MNVYDRRANVSVPTVIAVVLWVVVGALMGAGLIVMAFGPWRVGVVLTQMSCMSAPIAATVSVRVYAIRMANLVRRLHGVERVDEESPADRR